MRKKRSFTITVLGKTWDVAVLTAKTFNKYHKKDEKAVTRIDLRSIHFRIGETDLETVRHELFHAYLGECCIGSADLTAGAMEEICAELISKRGHEILKTAYTLYRVIRHIG